MPPAVALLAISFASGIALREVAHVPARAALVCVFLVAVVVMRRWRRGRPMGVATLAQALALGTEARHRRIHEVADRMRLPRLATFVERMAAPTAR